MNNDQRIFTRVASRTKRMNIRPAIQIGGKRL